MKNQDMEYTKYAKFARRVSRELEKAALLKRARASKLAWIGVVHLRNALWGYIQGHIQAANERQQNAERTLSRLRDQELAEELLQEFVELGCYRNWDEFRPAPANRVG